MNDRHDDPERFQHLSVKDCNQAEHRLELQKLSYKTTGNTFHALTAFLICREYKADVPDWVLDWLQDGFLKFNATLCNKEMKSDLGTCLGIDSQVRKDRPTHFDKLAIKNVHSALQQKVRLLMNTYGFTRDQACDLVTTMDKQLPNQRKTTILKEQLVALYKREKWEDTHVGECIEDDELFRLILNEHQKNELQLERSTRKKLHMLIRAIQQFDRDFNASQVEQRNSKK